MAQADYKGIKIYDKVIIVERTSTTDGGYNWRGRTVNQGYVVDINNAKMLENALNWAKWTKYDESVLEGKRYWDKTVTDAQRKAYDDTKTTVDGVVHEYENGKFRITLDEAAGRSNQGSKLSFWNCIITGPDGHNFLVGINSELLLHLMMTTTLVNGACQEKVWLGRVKGTQVGVFTPDMEDFAQAKKDEDTRNRKKTKTYKPGDIVETITTKELYVGEFYMYADEFQRPRTDWYYYSRSKPRVIIYKKPIKMYGYVSLNSFWASNGIHLSPSKTARTVVGQDVEHKDNLVKLVNEFRTRYKEIKVSDQKDLNSFRHFVQNMCIRTTDTYTQKDVYSDVLDVLKYEHQEEFEEYKTHVCLDEPYENEEKYGYSSFDYFEDYSDICK